ncbi:ImmA/IrrE family metallo-endopeptidase [Bifidobacterium pullorum]|nr:ImmA/IrrE family metallo-endopeptidase [Bifidobacterium pullorum]
MMQTSVGINVPSRILDWVLNIGSKDRLTDAQLSNIREWRSGASLPTVKDIRTISDRLQVPFGYFFLSQPIDDTPPVCAHRTIGSRDIDRKPSRDLVDTVYAMSALQDWARQDRIDHDEEPFDFVGSVAVDVDSAGLTEALRQVLRLDEYWYRDGANSNPDTAFVYLRDHAEQAGIIVMMSGIVGENVRRRLDPEEFRAFALIDEYAPLVFINRADEPASARLFSLVHELAHILLGEDELYNDKSVSVAVTPVERLCNAAATALLMPDEDFSMAWGAAGGDADERIRAVRKLFPVSWVTVALRALHHRYISEEQYDAVCKRAKEWTATQKSRNVSSGGNYYATKSSRFDHRLLDRIVASVAEGRTSYTEAYRMTGTNRRTFQELLKRVEP